MTLQRLIYASRPFGFDNAVLGGIMIAARRNNRRDDITGALICRADLYLQLLEGPAAAIAALYARIGADDRHCDIEPLHAATVATRLFPAWDMLDDPAQSWLWSAAEVAAGAISAAPPSAIVAVFERLAAERKVTQAHASTEIGEGVQRATCPAAVTA